MADKDAPAFSAEVYKQIDELCFWWQAERKKEGKRVPQDGVLCLLDCVADYRMQLELIREEKRKIDAMIAEGRTPLGTKH